MQATRVVRLRGNGMQECKVSGVTMSPQPLDQASRGLVSQGYIALAPLLAPQGHHRFICSPHFGHGHSTRTLYFRITSVL
jgi:hypothetical protein